MADGVTSNEVKRAIKNCNDALKDVGNYINSLDVVDDLRATANELSEAWQTTNGKATMTELFKVLDSLETYTHSLRNAAEEIKNDEFSLDTSNFRTEPID